MRKFSTGQTRLLARPIKFVPGLGPIAHEKKLKAALWLLFTALLTSILAVPPTASLAGEDETGVTFEERVSFARCHDQVNFLNDIPMERAQIRDGDDSNDRVPEDYEVMSTKEEYARNFAGLEEDDTVVSDLGDVTTTLMVVEVRCDEMTLGGNVHHDVRMAFAEFPLKGPPAGIANASTLGNGEAENAGCTRQEESGNEPLNSYVLFFSTNSKPFADWLRAGTDLEAYYVPGMVHDYRIPEEFGVDDFSFVAPTPANWAFTARGRAATQRLEPLCIAEEWRWQDTKTPGGNTWRVRLASQEHDNFIFSPTEVTLTAEPGSELERIFVTNPAMDPLAASGYIPAVGAMEKSRTNL